jgi:hypothetical protein
MRSITKKGRYFIPKRYSGWSSSILCPHRFTLKGVEYTFDGYDFKIGNNVIDNFKSHQNGGGNVTYKKISTITKDSGRKNYMGYCDDMDYYTTFDEDQIEFI